MFPVRSLWVAAIASAVTSALWMVQPWLLGQLVDGRTILRFPAWVVLVSVTIFWALVSKGAEFLKGIAEVNGIGAVRTALLERSRIEVKEKGIPAYNDNLASNILTDSREYVSGVVSIVCSISSSLTSVVVAVILVLRVNKAFLLFIAISLIVGILLTKEGLRKLEYSNAKALDMNAQLVDETASFVRSYEEIRVFDAFGEGKLEIDDTVSKMTSALRGVVLTKFIYLTVPSLIFALVPTVCVALAMIFLVPRGNLSVGEVITVFTVAGMVVSPVQVVTESLESFKKSEAAKKRIPTLKRKESLISETANLPIIESSLCLNFAGITCDEFQAEGSYSDSFKRSDLVMISGASGCGKTTLLRVLAGLKAPEYGFVEIWNGQQVEKPSNRYRDLIGYCPQEPGLETEEVSGILADILGLDTGLDDFLSDISDTLAGSSTALTVGELSGGQKRRLALGRLLASTKPILLLDEPFSGLDEHNCVRLAKLLNSQRSRIVVHASHHIPCQIRNTKIIAMKDGN